MPFQSSAVIYMLLKHSYRKICSNCIVRRPNRTASSEWEKYLEILGVEPVDYNVPESNHCLQGNGFLSSGVQLPKPDISFSRLHSEVDNPKATTSLNLRTIQSWNQEETISEHHLQTDSIGSHYCYYYS